VKTPAEIVKVARNAKNPLHDGFEWDNEKCGEQYRIWQARELLIEFEITIEGTPCRGAVSFKIDRENGGGYHDVKRVVKKKDMLAQFENEARDTAAQFAARFTVRFGPLRTRLPELFSAIERIAHLTASKQEKSA
jgi:hypothetical protein